MRLKNKVAIITAAGSGMGSAGCDVFASEGAIIVAADKDQKRLAELVDRVSHTGATIRGIAVDLRDPDGCRSVVEQAASKYGGVDILWNHAGIPAQQAVEDFDLDDFARTMDLNLRTGLLLTAAVLPYMRRRGGGSIVFTSSVAGLVGGANSPIYSASKFGVVGLAKSLALRYAKEKIRVNVVCPGPIETPMFSEFFGPKPTDEALAAIHTQTISAIPLARMGLPKEVANAAAWLASDEASFVTGVALPVDGGFTAR